VTRIAIFADIHGNLPALEAVLEDIAGAGVDEILVGGDLVGRGPEGSRVVERIAALGVATIGGNHEDYLLSFRRREVPGEWLEREEWAASRWMAAELTDEAAEWIDGLPFSVVAETAPGLRLVHGTPASNQEGIGPWTRDDEITAHLAAVAEPLLVCAHTHRPLLRRQGERMVVNVGSVGLPFNRDRRAQYAIFELGSAGWEAEFRQVEYDRSRVLEVYRRSGFLAQGGVTARLLEMELEHATPLLVPFLKWAEVVGAEPATPQLGRFLEFHRPGDSLRVFFERLMDLV